MGELVVKLPLPPRELHAHNTGHWRSKSKPTRACRDMARLKVLSAGAPTYERGRLSIRFYWRNRQRRDTLNAIQSVKPYIDGIIDAGVLPDDCWEVMEIGEVVSAVDASDPRVELTITKIESEAM